MQWNTANTVSGGIWALYHKLINIHNFLLRSQTKAKGPHPLSCNVLAGCWSSPGDSIARSLNRPQWALPIAQSPGDSDQPVIVAQLPNCSVMPCRKNEVRIS